MPVLKLLRRGEQKVRPSIVFLCLAGLLMTACSGLGGEPIIMATLPPVTDPPPETSYPLDIPDVALGARIFAANCVRCHGVGGAGDGEFVISGQVAAMNSFRDPATARGQTPQDWFSTITNGRIEKLMPPWREALSEDERWAVALYTYTLHYTPEQLASGSAVWEAECADCHGLEGRGDGPQAAEINRPVGDLTAQSEMITLSDEVIYTIVSEGQGEHMPAFADDLSEADRRAVAAYTRSLGLANAESIAFQPTQPAVTEAAIPEATVDVNAEETGNAAATLPPGAVSGTAGGQVVNGTAASSLPTDLSVTLLASSTQGSIITQRDTTVNADGTFSFPDVPIVAGANYVAAVVYRDRLFTSRFVAGDTAVTALDLPITIYELTEDPAVLSISGVVAQVSAIGETLEVRQVIRFTNNSDRVFTSSTPIEANRFASVLVSLPPGSQIISFDDPARYITAQDSFSFVDTAPVFPGGDHLVVVVYILPYDGVGAVIEQPFSYPVRGQVRLLMSPDTIRVTSEQLPLIGQETVGQQTYSAYGGELTLAPGAALRYEVSGAAGDAATGVSVTTAPGGAILPMLLLIAGGAAVLAGLILFVRERQRGNSGANTQRLIDALVRQLADIDDAHAAGQLNHDVWQRQRAQLKARLADLLGEESGE